MSLLDGIENAALDSTHGVADALRKAIALGGQVGSTPLREWASRELKGYEGSPSEAIPDYRKVPAGIAIDGISGVNRISHQRIGLTTLPDWIQNQVEEIAVFGHPIAQIEDMGRTEEYSSLSLPMGADIARFLSEEWNQQITAIYWHVPPSSVRTIVDRVRTSLTELVAEIRAGVGSDSGIPSAELASQATSIAVYGDGTRVTVTNAQAAGIGAQATASSAESISPGWSTGQKLVGILGLIATIIGAYLAYLALD